MPARSKAQQRLFGMVHAVQKGEMKAPSAKIRELARRVNPQDARDFAATRRKGLPEKKSSVEKMAALLRLHELLKAAGSMSVDVSQGSKRNTDKQTRSRSSEATPVDQLYALLYALENDMAAPPAKRLDELLVAMTPQTGKDSGGSKAAAWSAGRTASVEKMAALLRRHALIKAAREADPSAVSSTQRSADASLKFDPEDPASGVPDPLFAATAADSRRRRIARLVSALGDIPVGAAGLLAASSLARGPGALVAVPAVLTGMGAASWLKDILANKLATRKGIDKSLTPQQEYLLRLWTDLHWRPDILTSSKDGQRAISMTPVSTPATYPQLFAATVREMGGHPLKTFPEIVDAIRKARRRATIGAELGSILGAGSGLVLSLLAGAQSGALEHRLGRVAGTLGGATLGGILGRYIGGKLAPPESRSEEALHAAEMMMLTPVLGTSAAKHYLKEKKKAIKDYF